MDSGFESNKPEVHETSSDEEKPRRRRRERVREVTSGQPEVVKQEQEVVKPKEEVLPPQKDFVQRSRVRARNVLEKDQDQPDARNIDKVAPAAEEVSKITLKQEPLRSRSRFHVQQEEVLKQEIAPKEEVIHAKEINKITLKPESRTRSGITKFETMILPEVTFRQEKAPREEIMHKQEVNRITLKKVQQPEIILKQETAPKEEIMHKNEVSRITIKPRLSSNVDESEKKGTHTTFATFQVKSEPEVTHKAFATLNLTVNADSGALQNISSQNFKITSNGEGASDAKFSSEIGAEQPVKTPLLVAPKTRKPEAAVENNQVDIVKSSSPIVSRRIRGKNTPEKEISSDTSKAAAKRSQQKAPVFTRKMQDFEVFEGDSARFDCQVTGVPEPHIMWLKDDEEIKENRRKYVFDCDDSGRCSLIIKNCTEEDDAVYECRAANSAGKTDCSAELYVETAGSEEE